MVPRYRNFIRKLYTIIKRVYEYKIKKKKNAVQQIHFEVTINFLCTGSVTFIYIFFFLKSEFRETGLNENKILVSKSNYV